MKDVQCYELFGRIALKNHAFSFSFKNHAFSFFNRHIAGQRVISNCNQSTPEYLRLFPTKVPLLSYSKQIWHTSSAALALIVYHDTLH